MMTPRTSQQDAQPADRAAASSAGAHPASHVTQALDEDHGRLQELTAMLASVQDRDTLTEALEDLAHTLREHFAHEEHAKGLYGILTSRGLEHQAEIARLVAEHRELLRDLQHLVAQAQERPAPTQALGREAAALTARLHDHETREMRLVQALA